MSELARPDLEVDSMRHDDAISKAPLGLALLLALGCAGTPPAKTPAGTLPPCPDKPNCVSSLAPDDDHRAEPYQLGPGADWAAVRTAVMALPRTVIVDERDGYLHAEATSRIMRFVDDLELLRSETGNRVDVRSASRVGYGDWGVNRARVESLREALVAAGAISGGAAPR
jgi:uncharacterized protein (DUF1499 family)